MAYAAGLKVSKTKKKSLNQITLMRLLLLNTNILIQNSTFKNENGTLIELFQEACGTEANINVLFNTLDDMYKELVEKDGISNNDKAN